MWICLLYRCIEKHDCLAQALSFDGKLRGRGEGCRELSGCLPAGPVERNFLNPLCEEGDKGSGGHSRCTRGNCALLDGSCLVRCGSFVCALVAVSAVHFLCRKENEPKESAPLDFIREIQRSHDAHPWAEV